MKKRNIFYLAALCLIGFTACEDAKDPIINTKALDGTLDFSLNNTQYANMTYVLEDANAEKEMYALTCTQPDYGFTAAVKYTTQICFDDTFAEGTFQNLPTTVNGEKVGLNTKEMDKAIIALYGGSLPEPVVEKDVYIRLQAVVSESTPTPLNDSTLVVKPLYSNSVKLNILPYVLPLFPYMEVEPRVWYIVGLGDGAWNNSIAGLGKSLIPLSLSPGKKYNLSGDGEFTYTGYFSASSGFKLVRDAGSWGEQWGNAGGDGIDNPHRKMAGESDPGNFKVPADGYYTITINSIENTATIESTSIAPAAYAKIGLIGAMADSNWSTDINMTASLTTNNHIWYTEYTFAADAQCKFRANSDWGTNWGTPASADADPLYTYRGLGANNGKNVGAKTGKYIIILNDIDGCYYFIKK